MKLAVLGAGAWGTALAAVWGEVHSVTLWARDPEQARQLAAHRVNERYLPEVNLPAAVAVTSVMGDALASAEYVIAAVPSTGLRKVLQQLAPVGKAISLLWLCKGFEPDSVKLPHQIVQEELPAASSRAVLSGPSFADEVGRGMPAAVILASDNAAFAETTARALHTPRLRIYSSNDLIGVEIGGAVKNVIAIASGICDGLGLGQSARAALVTRGLAELTRLGMRMGGRQETFMGLSGVGDLMLTCNGNLSRNRKVGLKLAEGKTLDAALAELGHVAEGVHTAREVRRLAQQLQVDMPITEVVCRVLFEGVAPHRAVEELLRRDPKAEASTAARTLK
jgi:glycerol-3-phosphate dehydrogenase (NAD(P)+)